LVAISACEGHREEFLIFDLPDSYDHFGKRVVTCRPLVGASEASWGNVLITDDDFYNRIVNG
jgi:hypothetical protein